MRSIGSSGVSFTRCTPLVLGYAVALCRGLGGTGLAPTPLSTGVGGTLCLVLSLILQGLLKFVMSNICQQKQSARRRYLFILIYDIVDKIK